MKKKISWIELIIVVVLIFFVVKGWGWWSKSEVRSVNYIAPEMILVKGGTFEFMGNNYYKDKPGEVVDVRSFYMGKYEVTNKEYVKFLNDMGNQLGHTGVTWKHVEERRWKPGEPVKTNWIDMTDDSSNMGIEFINPPDDPNSPNVGNFQVKRGFENYPVICVTWYGAVAYCNWLSEREGLTPVYENDLYNEDPEIWLLKEGYRLPTEVEWEYACRAGTDSEYYWGDEINGDYCWYLDNSKKEGKWKIYEVGMKLPNDFGFYDMSGNVGEWCNDGNILEAYKNSNSYDERYAIHRSYCGGSYLNNKQGCSSYSKSGTAATVHAEYIGFRLCHSESN